MRNKYVIGGRAFASKKALKTTIREIIACNPIDAPLTGDDDVFFRSLIERHKDAELKIGCGIEYFYPAYDDWGVKAMRLHRVDGTSTDFSWVQCVTSTSHASDVRAALRNEIDEQRYAVKRQAFPVDGMTIICPVNGNAITWEQAHVDHKPPLSFHALVEIWMENRKLIYADIAVTGGIDNEQVCLLRDRKLAKDWQEFHNMFAELRVISALANLQQKK